MSLAFGDVVELGKLDFTDERFRRGAKVEHEPQGGGLDMIFREANDEIRWKYPGYRRFDNRHTRPAENADRERRVVARERSDAFCGHFAHLPRFPLAIASFLCLM